MKPLDQPKTFDNDVEYALACMKNPNLLKTMLGPQGTSSSNLLEQSLKSMKPLV